MKATKTIALLFAVALVTGPVSADILGSITGGISSAANTVSNGLNTAANAVGSGVQTAVDAVGSGLNTAVNATAQGLNTAVNKTGGFINTATSSVKDAYNVTEQTVTTFTSSVQTALTPAANTVSGTFKDLGNTIYNVTTGTYRGVVEYRSPSSPSGPAAGPSTATNVTGATGTSSVDATNATSIVSALTTNSSGFISVANSFLVALGQQQSAGVESGIKNIINNSTGNTTYPAAAPNSNVSLALAQAITTALITANNYSVTVDFNGTKNTVNSTQVVNVFLAGLQDAITPCARNVTSTSNATSGSAEYFTTIASGCCYLVAQPLTYTTVLARSNGVGTVFDQGLGRSQLLGQSPSLDITRCLSNSTASS